MNAKKDLILDFCKKWCIFVFVAFFMAGGFRYVYLSARNIVFMDFWRNICKFIEPVMEGEWPWKEFWYSQIGQRNFLQMFLVAFNIKFTGLNCLWESYAGIFIIGCTSLIIWVEWKKSCSTSKMSEWIHIILFIPILVVLFNLNQWEILSLQFSFAFMLRIFCYIFIMYFTNKFLQNRERRTYKYLILGFFIAVVIDFMSQLYWPALVFTLCITWGIDIYRNKQCNIKIFLSYWMPILGAIFLYLYKLNTTGAGSNWYSVFKIVRTGGFLLAILYMLAGIIMPQSVLQDISEMKILAIGFVFLLIVIIGICIYFKKGMESISYFPMMLCTYGLISIPIITYGRAGSFDLMYLTSSRYTCETGMIFVGIAFSYGLYLISNQSKWLGVVPLVVLTGFIIYTDVVEWKIAPFRGVYKDNLVDIMKNIDNYEDEELVVFQAGNPNLVRNGVKLMSKYHLNIFYNENLSRIGNTLESASSKVNIWEDSWVGPNGSLKLLVGNEGIISISTYNPFYERHLDGRCEILINGEVKGAIDLAQQSSAIIIETEPEKIIQVEFRTNYYEDEMEPGERQLCFILSDLEAK